MTTAGTERFFKAILLILFAFVAGILSSFAFGYWAASPAQISLYDEGDEAYVEIENNLELRTSHWVVWSFNDDK